MDTAVLLTQVAVTGSKMGRLKSWEKHQFMELTLAIEFEFLL